MSDELPSDRFAQRFVLNNVVDFGIGYLSLLRKTDTLSGGEVKRIKLASEQGNACRNIRPRRMASNTICHNTTTGV